MIDILAATAWDKRFSLFLYLFLFSCPLLWFFSPKSTGPPPPVVLTPNKEYNPTESATWRALLETENPPDLEKTKDYTAMNEHDPIYSEIYSVPKAPGAGQKPVRQAFISQSPMAKAGSPRLPSGTSSPARECSPKTVASAVSPVAAAALAEPSPSSRGRSPKNEPLPLYEVSVYCLTQGLLYY